MSQPTPADIAKIAKSKSRAFINHHVAHGKTNAEVKALHDKYKKQDTARETRIKGIRQILMGDEKK